MKSKAGDGRVIHVTPQNARWKYVGFDLWKLQPGGIAVGNDGDRETCLIFVSGQGQVHAGTTDYGVIGERTSPFQGSPWSVYVPAAMTWSVKAASEVTLAVCTAPGSGKLPARIIPPIGLGKETYGKGNNIRHMTSILPERDRAENLLVVEIITPAGNTSSYPPHKHDDDNLPHEALLEKVCYHRLDPPQGFAFQRVYTGDRSLDEAMAVEDGDVTLVPRGYHPCAAIHGYDLYTLNVMAGPKRIWKFHTAREHEWLLKA
jgi:5-deoxy-glucuronate isomerase